jgi:CRP-like cAMP-binding protein
MMMEREAALDLFQWLPEEVRGAFLRDARVRSYAAGDIIYQEGEPGDHMYRLASGNVRLFVARASGHEIIYRLFEPGDCFGVSSLIDQAQRPQTAEAGSDVEVQVLSRAAFDRLRTEHRVFEDGLLRLLARQMRLLSTFNADSHLNDLPARVASRIITAAQSFGVDAGPGVRLSVHLPQSELASMVGASRQSINKVLRQFQDDGLITIEYGNLVIRAWDSLRKRAGGA